MPVNVQYPHDPERLDKWIGRHASVIQAWLAIGWTVVAIGSILWAILGEPVALLFPVATGLFVGFFGWWTYQEGGDGGDNEG